MFPMNMLYIYLGLNLESVSQAMEGNFSFGTLYYVCMGIGLVVLIVAVYILVTEAKKEIDIILA